LSSVRLFITSSRPTIRDGQENRCNSPCGWVNSSSPDELEARSVVHLGKIGLLPPSEEGTGRGRADGGVSRAFALPPAPRHRQEARTVTTTRRTFLSIGLAAGAGLAVIGRAVGDTPAAVRDLGSRRELFIDRF